jgi:hypothetical protein
VVVDSTELIVHRALLEGIGDPDLAVNSLYVVGVTERELFWRDIRRVLFSHSRYSVLCRLGRDGPQSSWTPVKLVDVLKEVSSDLGAGIQEVGGYLDRQHEQGPDAVDDQAREAAMRRALSTYAEDIVRQHGHEPTAEDLAALDLESESQGGEHATREGRRATFAELSARLEARFGFQAEPLVAAQLRAAALDAAGFDLEGNLREPAGKEERPDSPAEAPRYLDSNIVAIYW